MAKVILKRLSKIYESKVKAVKDINLNIEDGEFVVLVGPSGCGKSTTLRMIAGLEEISTGELYIGDKLVNNVEPVDRDIAMVFQNYALYPHFSVYENMAFALKIKKIPKDEIKIRIENVAKILELEELLNRKPKALSGGQRQRVALGRAIVREPKVFLMDEPLSNLDAKLRVSMRSEIIKLHKKLKTTFIYVTHDQTEAMTMGDKIVVMNKGEIQQVADPVTIYQNPKNKFVASFIGSPQMNFFNVSVNKVHSKLYIENDEIKYEIKNKVLKKNLEGNYDKSQIIAGIRPEDIKIIVDDNIIADLEKNILSDIISGKSKNKKIKDKNSYNDQLEENYKLYEEFQENLANQMFKGEIDLVEILGSETYIHFKIKNNKMICKVNGVFKGKEGDFINVIFDFNKVHFFDNNTEERINDSELINYEVKKENKDLIEDLSLEKEKNYGIEDYYIEKKEKPLMEVLNLINENIESNAN